MEKEKRKRNEEEGEEGVEKKVSKKEEGASEEEVEEFFAILRRMKVAMNYFEKAGGKGWRSSVEAQVVAAAEVEEEEKESRVDKKGEALEVESGGGLLDLNAVPEEKS